MITLKAKSSTSGLPDVDVYADPTTHALLTQGGGSGGSTVLGAGTALIGKVGIDQTTPGTTESVTVKTAGAGGTVSITRPNGTAAYTANDVIGAATGSTAAIEFTNIGTAGKPIMITDATLRIDVAAIPSGMDGFRLHLYSATPPSALGDNAAWDLPAGDRSVYLDYIDFASAADLGSTLFSSNSGVNKGVKLVTTSLFGYLITKGAFTPAALTVKSISLVATGGL